MLWIDHEIGLSTASVRSKHNNETENELKKEASTITTATEWMRQLFVYNLQSDRKQH